MRFIYEGDDPGLLEAVEFVNELSLSEGFWQALAGRPQFTYTNLSSAEISRRVRAVEREVRVQHYYRDNDAVAATDPAHPFTMFYNTKYMGNSVRRKSNTLTHEFVHNVDMFGDGTRNLEYTHPRRSTATRPRSAPYAIGRLAQDWWDMAHPPEARELLGDEKAEPEVVDCDVERLRDDEISWVTPRGG